MSFTGRSSENDNIVIPDSGFWPGFETNNFRSSMRILNSVKNEQVTFNFINAIDHVITELQDFEKRFKTETITRLEDVPLPIIAGEHRGLLKFKTAVYSEAKARILETFRDMDLARKAGQDQAEKEDAYIRELRRDSISAIRELLGFSSVYVGLV